MPKFGEERQGASPDPGAGPILDIPPTSRLVRIAMENCSLHQHEPWSRRGQSPTPAVGQPLSSGCPRGRDLHPRLDAEQWAHIVGTRPMLVTISLLNQSNFSDGDGVINQHCDRIQLSHAEQPSKKSLYWTGLASRVSPWFPGLVLMNNEWLGLHLHLGCHVSRSQKGFEQVY